MSASPAAGAPRPRLWTQAIARAIRGQHTAGTTVEELARTLKLPETTIRAILGEPKP